MKARAKSRARRVLSLAASMACLMAALSVFSLPAAAESVKLRAITAQSSSRIDPPSHAIDGDYGNMYSSANEAASWIMIELDKVYDVDRVDLYCRSDYVGFPVSFLIYTSVNGVDWSVAPGGNIANYPPPKPADPEKTRRSFPLDEPVAARFIRINTIKAFWDGGSNLTQFSEIEVFGTATSYVPPGGEQAYSLDYIANADARWYQYENMQRQSYYVSGAFYVPYYTNPFVPASGVKSPSIAKVGDNWVLVYEGADGLYAYESKTDNLTGEWNTPRRLIGKGSYQRLASPYITVRDGKGYIAFEAVTDEGRSRLAVVEYGQTVSFSDAHLMTVSGESGARLGRPSLTYDGGWRLYYTVTAGGQTTMRVAETSTAAPAGFRYTKELKKLVNGNVIKLKEGYAALFPIYDEYGQGATEWAYSDDGIDFSRRSVLVDRVWLETGRYYSTGFGTIALDENRIVRGVLTEQWLDQSDLTAQAVDTNILLALPQRKAVVSYQNVTLNNSMALDEHTQIVQAHRDYTVTDRVVILERPGEKAKYEEKRAMAQSSVAIVRDAENPGAMPPGITALQPAVGEDMKIIKAVSAYADNFANASTAGEAVIEYINSNQWRTTPIHTPVPPIRSVEIVLAGKEPVELIRVTHEDLGYSYPLDFCFEYSEDGKNFREIPGMRFINYPVLTKQDLILKLPFPVEAKAIRMVIPRYNAALTNVCEVAISKIYVMSSRVSAANTYTIPLAGQDELPTAYKGQPLTKAVPVAADASSTLGDLWPADNVLDDTSACWFSGANTTDAIPQWLSLDLGAVKNVAVVDVAPRADFLYFPLNFTFQYSTDGENWTACPGGEVQDYPVPREGKYNVFTFDSPVNARYIRMYISRTRGDKALNYMAHIQGFHAYTVS